MDKKTLKRTKAKSIWDEKEVNYQNGTVELKELLTNSVFDYAKPVYLIKRALEMIANDNGEIFLDFFSGSATTAHAVMQLNAEDGGNRKFIMVQLPEPCDEKSEAYKAGYKTIAEIGKERIRRAGKKILEEHPEAADKLDIGFRVLKVDSSNMQDVYYRPDEYTQDLLALLTDNIKPDRTPEDLLFQVMLDLGVLLSSKIEEIVIGGKKVFSVADGYLMACFDRDVTDEVVREIAKRQPYYAVFRDSGIANDSVATNFEQIFETYSPSTIRKVL
jgi:adenine-specific DNA-methyltransferase